MKFRQLPFAVLCTLTLLVPMHSFGSIVTYGVDLSRTDATSGHRLTLTGTITVDADLSFNAGFQTSDLQVIHEGGTPVSLNFLPSFIGDTNANLKWVADGLSLFVERIGTGDSSATFTSPLGLESADFQLGSGSFAHQLGYENFLGADTAPLRTAGGTDVGSGMLIGVVPEPSSFLMIVVGMSCLAGRRKKIA